LGQKRKVELMYGVKDEYLSLNLQYSYGNKPFTSWCVNASQYT